MTLLVLFVAPLIIRTGWGPDAAAVQAAFGLAGHDGVVP